MDDINSLRFLRFLKKKYSNHKKLRKKLSWKIIPHLPQFTKKFKKEIRPSDFIWFYFILYFTIMIKLWDGNTNVNDNQFALMKFASKEVVSSFFAIKKAPFVTVMQYGTPHTIHVNNLNNLGQILQNINGKIYNVFYKY